MGEKKNKLPSLKSTGADIDFKCVAQIELCSAALTQLVKSQLSKLVP